MASSYETRLGNAPEEGIKAPVAVATNGAITLLGEQTINTVAVVQGDRVLVRNQADPAENGIYDVSVGEWSRSKDWNRANDVANGVLVVDAHDGSIFQAFFSGTWEADVTEVTFSVFIVSPGELIVLDTFADLRSQNPALGTWVQIRGHTSDGDGGGGDFFWNSTSTDTDDNGIYAKYSALTTGRWQRNITTGVYDVRLWGAVADGVTVNTVAAQAATDYVGLTIGSGTVYWPQLADPFVCGTVTGRKRVKWLGDRLGNHENTSTTEATIKYDDSTGSLVTMDPSPDDTMMGMAFEGLIVDGNDTTDPLFYLKSFRNRFNDCMLSNADVLVKVGDTVGWSGETYLENCWLQDFDTGVYYSGSTSQDGKISDCIFVTGVATGTGTGTYCVRCDNGGLQIQGCHLYGGLASGGAYIYTASTGCMIQSNLISPVTASAYGIRVLVQSSVRQMGIQNNRIDISSVSGGSTTNATGILVETLNNTVDVTITGNWIRGFVGSTGCVGIKTAQAAGGSQHFIGSITDNFCTDALTQYDLDSNGTYRWSDLLISAVQFSPPRAFFDNLGTPRKLAFLDADPEGSESANVGSLAIVNTAVAGNQLWIKDSGTGDTGWTSAQEFYQTTTFSLGDISATINTTIKYVTKLVLTTDTNEVYSASGGAAGDLWINLAGGSNVTPA